MRFLRGRALGFGLILTLASAFILFSSLSHQMNGVEATATVLEHIAVCKVEYQLVVENHATERPMECGAATEFQKRIGENKVKLYRQDKVRLRYVAQGGKPHEAMVEVAIVLAHDAAVGAQLPIVYDPNHLDDVRAPISMAAFDSEVGMLLVGVSLLMIGFGIGPMSIVKALAGRPKPSFTLAEADEDGSEAAIAARLRVATPPSPGVQPSFSSASRPSFGKRGTAGLRA